MKNIIISGTGRAGKSTLARKIGEELNYFVINNDRLVAIFSEAFPQLNIRFGCGETIKNIAPFIGHFLGMFSSPAGRGLFPCSQGALKQNPFVLEGWAFDFEQILPILNMYGITSLKEHFTLIGLSLNNKTPSQQASDMKKYDNKHDWTYGLNDIERTKLAEENIAYNKTANSYLQNHGFTMYDTSTEREKIFAKIITDIKTPGKM
ncbi:MAG: hypothetical protein FWC78_07900 [Defluviitaleaceae bacterium]|nr:hypothetical protein [Defluviitaleaceae bacterium]